MGNIGPDVTASSILGWKFKGQYHRLLTGFWKSREVLIKTWSTPASHSFKGQATKHTTVKWSIAKNPQNFNKNSFFWKNSFEIISLAYKEFCWFSIKNQVSFSTSHNLKTAEPL